MDENTVRYFQVLNLEPTATAEEIYQAYRDMARVWDPQRFAHSPRLELKAEDKLREIIEAYRALQPGGYQGAPSGDESGSAAPQAAPMAPDPFAPMGRPNEQSIADRHHSTGWSGTPSAPPAPAADEKARPIADLHRGGGWPQMSSPPPVASSITQTPGAIADLHRSGQNASPIEYHARVSAILPDASGKPAPTAPAPVLEPPAAQAPVLPPQAGPAVTGTFAPLPPQGTPLGAVTGTYPPLPGATTGTFPPLDAHVVPAKPRSKAMTFAVAGGMALLVVAGGIFLYEAVRTPTPSRPLTSSSTVATLPLEAPAPQAAETPATQTPEPAAAQTERSSESAAAKARRGKAKPQAEEAPRQLATGTELITPLGRGGAGRFRIVNNSGQDAVARVSNQSSPESALRLVYIQTGTEVSVGNIGPGLYVVSFSMGPVTSKPRSFGARYGPFQFIQVESVNGAQSDQYQITLKPKP